MRIAILGATSQIAKDLIKSFAKSNEHELALYARRPEIVTQWLARTESPKRYTVSDFTAFRADKHFDAIINFVGIGDPAQAAAIGAAIFDVTLTYDEMALDYLRQHPECRYIFLSSGAAYGSSFDVPAEEKTKAMIAINDLLPQDWYGVAKLHAECRHRSLPYLPIVDIRVFNYFSRTQDTSSRFLITDILRSIKSGEKLVTSPDDIVRDYIGPDDFHQLMSLILECPVTNTAVDCYTKAPVQKFAMLQTMKEKFGLVFTISDKPAGVSATGTKINYFSNCRNAERFGYSPTKTAMETILDEVDVLLKFDSQLQA